MSARPTARWAALIVLVGAVESRAQPRPIHETRRAIVRLGADGRASGSGAGGLRGPVACWSSARLSGHFRPSNLNQVVLDWGDLPADCATFDAFTLGYAGDPVAGAADLDVVFYESDDGFNSPTRAPRAVFRLRDLPLGPQTETGWIVTVALDAPLSLGAAGDVDGDGLGDFSYSYHFRSATPGVDIGPLVAGDPNVAPGAEDAYDLYVRDPNHPPGPNDVLLAGVNTLYEGSFQLGFPNGPYAQLLMELRAADPQGAGCPLPGCERADIDPALGGDCDVDLTDLAVLLSNFGVAAGATRWQGDIDPAPGGVDGDVDLVDLAVMLSAFGATCE